MNDEDEPPLNPLDAQLMALLDGELDEEQRESLEKRLVAEPDLRKRLRALQRSWELLGEVPHKTVDQRFANTTVEMIVTRATQELRSLPLAINGGRKGRWTLLLACTATFLLGGLSVAGYRTWRYYKELRDLEIVTHFDALRQIDDIAFLRELSTSEAWRKHIATGIEVNRIKSQARADLSTVALRERPAALQDLSESQLGRIKIAWDDWLRSPPEQQQEIRKRLGEIMRQPNGDELLAQAGYYAAWLEALSPTESSKITTVPAAERVAHITKQFTAIENDWNERADDQHIHEFVSSLLAEWEKSPPRFLERVRQEAAGDANRVPSLRESIGRFFASRSRERGHPFEPLMDTILTSEQKDRLLSGLSESTKQKSPEELQLYLARRMSIEVRDWMFPQDNIEDFLQKIYSKLPPSKQEIIDLSPPDTLKKRIEEYTFGRHGPGGAGPPGIGPGPGRPGFGGRSDDGRPPPEGEGRFDRARRPEFREGSPPAPRP
jgi:hypothetical protein